jgi:hypothetical protein
MDITTVGTKTFTLFGMPIPRVVTHPQTNRRRRLTARAPRDDEPVNASNLLSASGRVPKSNAASLLRPQFYLGNFNVSLAARRLVRASRAKGHAEEIIERLDHRHQFIDELRTFSKPPTKLRDARRRVPVTKLQGGSTPAGPYVGSIPAAELRSRRRQGLPKNRPPWQVTVASASGHNGRLPALSRYGHLDS